MTSEVIVIGMGQLGSLLAEGWQRAGRTVIPVRRDTDLNHVIEQTPAPELVLVAVGEDDLAPVLASLPVSWKTKLGLLQNELRPSNWRSTGVVDPSVFVVWFERKNGKPPEEVRGSVVFGEHAELFREAVRPFGITAELLSSDPAEHAHALCLKNLFILTLNVCGLRTRGLAEALLTTERALFEQVFEESLELERALFPSSVELDRDRLFRELEPTIRARATFQAAGRTAPRRLERSLEHAEQLGLELPTFKAIQTELSR